MAFLWRRIRYVKGHHSTDSGRTFLRVPRQTRQDTLNIEHEAEAQGRVNLPAQQLKEAPMASREVAHHGADIDAQYANCVLIHSLRHAEEHDIGGSEFN